MSLVSAKKKITSFKNNLSPEEEAKLRSLLIEQSSTKKGKCWGPLAIMILERFGETLRSRGVGNYLQGLGEAIADVECGGLDLLDEEPATLAMAK